MRSIKSFIDTKKILLFIIVFAIILSVMIPDIKATNKTGLTKLNYTDVGIKSEKGKKLKIIITNQKNVSIDKIKIDGKDIESKLTKDSKTGNYYFYYTGESGTYLLEFYKKGANSPFVTRLVNISKKDEIFSTNFSPKIIYLNNLSSSYRSLKITDGNGVKDVTIYEKDSKGDYSSGYKLIENGKIISSNKPDFVSKVESVNNNNRFELTIKKDKVDKNYKIVATDVSDKQLMHTREIVINAVDNTNNNPSAQKWLNACDSMAKKLVKNGFRYVNSGNMHSYQSALKNRKTSNCAHYVSWALQDYGVLKSGQTFYHSNSIHYHNTATKNNIKKYAKIINVNKKIKDYYKNLKPGDICLYSGPAHTNVYAGRSGSKLYWYDAGTSAAKGGAGGKFKNIGKRSRWGINGKRVIKKIIRIDYSKVK